MKSLVLLTMLAFTGLCADAQTTQQIGIFTSQTDVGPVRHKGSATYDKATYTVSGSGENVWFKKDEMHFVWRPITGDFIATTQPSFVGQGTDMHRKTGWMIRSSLDTSAAMVTLTVHGDGLTSFQYRKKPNTNVEEVKTPVLYPDILQLERRGRSYFISVAKQGSPFWTVEVPDFDFPAELLVGLFVSSHNKDVVETAKLTNTRVYTQVK